MSEYYLVGDVGGTKTDLAFYSDHDNIRKIDVKQSFQTADYKSLGNLISNFLEETGLPVKSCFLAIAGPLVNDRVTLSSSNLPWEVDRMQLMQDLDIPELFLINDLEALAHAVPLLSENEIYTINQGIHKKNETIAIIAPGTGLGEAFLIWDGQKYQPCISEGSHANFGPRSEIEMDLLRYAKKSNDHVSYEMICSGLGIPLIYDFLIETSEFKESSWVIDLFERTTDRTRTIINAGINSDKKCEICEETIKIFVSVLGAETGNLMLKTMAVGGIYLGGGIPPIMLNMLESEAFTKAFEDKGIMTEIMRDVPIHVITTSEATLMGTFNYFIHHNNPAKDI